MTPDEFGKESACISRFRWFSRGKTYIAHAQSDGVWLVSEFEGRMLSASDSEYPGVMKIIKVGQSVGQEKIAADLTAWVHGKFGADVNIESF
ncbi:protein of unknown function [Ralstonia solanacearum CMR15]|uniref:hypothetical protein n=1 Tax=Ralstonia pseudosolanacearum TaxID=1310165 RepID=UPI0001D9461D|nr:hypothetical protein [Ralstonia pseudosolanacearum]CBJ38816.1 protein of unknown function [Ralstonia solanacearum CMR15]